MCYRWKAGKYGGTFQPNFGTVPWSGRVTSGPYRKLFMLLRAVGFRCCVQVEVSGKVSQCVLGQSPVWDD